MNGDGHLDLIVGDHYAGMFVHIGNGDGTFVAPQSSYGDASFFGTFSVDDFNGDEVLDLLVSRRHFNPGLNLFLANTRGTTAISAPNLLSQSSAREALTTTRATQDRISSELGAIGAMQSRLSSAAKNLAIQKENVTAAYSRITDVDVADETSRLVAGRVRQQAGAAVLAQANQSPALALRLLSG